MGAHLRVRECLNAGIMDGGVMVDRHLGTPQGAPLSPWLANVLFDEVDMALEMRGHRRQKMIVRTLSGRYDEVNLQ